MNNKKSLWIATIVAGMLMGCLSLYARVKSTAKTLSIKHDYQSNINISNQSEQVLAYERAEPNSSKKMEDIITTQRVDTFAAAWKTLTIKDRRNSIIFASVVSVAAGLIVHMAARSTINAVLLDVAAESWGRS